MLKKKRLIVEGVAVDVRESPPNGPPIVMVHGIGVSGIYFLPLAQEIMTDHHALIIDLPGYGTTPHPPKPLSIPALAHVVDCVVKIYKLHQPTLVGQSMGCQTI